MQSAGRCFLVGAPADGNVFVSLKPSEMTVNIGKDIRKRRKELGMSLRQLGEEAGLSVGFLSQVENDQVSPSLASLLAIATSLGVPVFYFLNTQQPDPVAAGWSAGN